MGYFNDLQEQIQEESGVSPIQIDVTNEALQAGDRQSTFNTWTVSMRTQDTDRADALMKRVIDNFQNKSTFESSNTIGSSVAGYARIQGILAILGSLVCIVIYLWLRFKKVVFGVASVVSLTFNVLFTLGCLALSYWLAPFLGFLGVSEFKIGLPVVAAFLTIIGYSLNDTIVLFDRIREVRGKSQGLSIEVVNQCINLTLSRTILTTLTTLFVALVLYFFGGAGIHTFAFAMCVGVLVGTFSTIFVAAPTLYWLMLKTTTKNKSGYVKNN